MLIAVAGTIGAGKSTVAEAIAHAMGIPLLSIDDDKRVEGAATPQFERWVSDGEPFPDDFRARAFGRTLERLAVVGADCEHAVVEETFHRKAIRDPFFDRADRLMGGLVVVEVVADEAIVLERLLTRATTESDHLAGVAMYQAFHAVSDPQDRADFVFRNDQDFAVELNRCCAYLRQQLEGGSSEASGAVGEP
jgi:dephospho-CoA kinase